MEEEVGMVRGENKPNTVTERIRHVFGLGCYRLYVVRIIFALPEFLMMKKVLLIVLHSSWAASFASYSCVPPACADYQWRPISHVQSHIRRDQLRKRIHAAPPLSTSTLLAIDPSPKSQTKYLRIFALAALIFQTSGLTVAMRLSRISKGVDAMYIASTAVVMSELLKTLISVYTFCFSRRAESSNAIGLLKLAWKESFSEWQDIMQVSFPSSLYVVQNNLQYLATSNLPAEVYQVLIQMKLIVTALFSIKILNRFQSFGQWICIFFLSIGLAVVQLSYKTASSPHVNLAVGLTSVFLCCLTSGLAGTVHELNLKQKSTSLSVRNIQMSSISLVLALFGISIAYLSLLLII